MYKFKKGDFVKRREGVFLYVVKEDFKENDINVYCSEIYISHKGIFKESNIFLDPIRLIVVKPQEIRQYMVTALFNNVIDHV